MQQVWTQQGKCQEKQNAAPGITAETQATSSPSGKFSVLNLSENCFYRSAWIMSLQRRKNNQSTHSISPEGIDTALLSIPCQT